MPKTYKHLNSEERDLIAVLKSKGYSLRAMAKKLQRDPGTLSRELRRNAPPVHQGYYLSHKAHDRALKRNQESHQRARLKSAELRCYVSQKLQNDWSPELIAGRWNRCHPSLAISHEAIYQWVYSDARHLIPHLVRAHKKRLRRGYSRKHRKTHIPERVSIQSRPKNVEERRQSGHWETDTAVSRQSRAALQISVERKTRYTKLAKLCSKAARPMSNALNRRLSRLPQTLRRTITYDNGSENVEHVRTNRILGTQSYFCEPFHSYEKGTVENTVGIVRRFFPKKTDFAIIQPVIIKRLERWINHRPRKCLNFQTPAEVFYTETVALTH